MYKSIKTNNYPQHKIKTDDFDEGIQNSMKSEFVSNFRSHAINFPFQSTETHDDIKN